LSQSASPQQCFIAFSVQVFYFLCLIYSLVSYSFDVTVNGIFFFLFFLRQSVPV
jgi:hypothetical protein